MVRFLELIDTYGTPHHFTIFGHKVHKTFIGGIFTVITLLLYILCFFSFGADFYLRRNPKYCYQKFTNPNYNLVNISNQNLFFVSRIEDDNGNYFNSTSFFNITVS